MNKREFNGMAMGFAGIPQLIGTRRHTERSDVWSVILQKDQVYYPTGGFHSA